MTEAAGARADLCYKRSLRDLELQVTYPALAE